MLSLTVEELIGKIKVEENVTAELSDGSITVIIEKYVPYICTAIHNGDNLRKDLEEKIILNKDERWREEDPFTDQFIEPLPIRIIANDSRFEYDLNRRPEIAIYEEAWGKKVWKKPLLDKEKKLSLKKHQNFYKVLEALVKKIESKFGAAIIYDIHSYNYQRENQKKGLPVFNIGTEKIDRNRFAKYIDRFKDKLKNIEFESIKNKVGENEVFFGRGYLLEYITNKFQNTLVLATEIKKVYCNEKNKDEYPEVISIIKHGLRTAIIDVSKIYLNNESNIKITKKYKLLSTGLKADIKSIDKEIYRLLKDFEMLVFINPVNIEGEKNKFFKSKYTREPKFKYRALNIDPYDVKKKLYELPIGDIEDITLRKLYKDVIEFYSKKVDLLLNRNTPNFKYLSLMLFGKPDKTDIANARYLIHSMNIDKNNGKIYDSLESVEKLRQVVEGYGFNCKVRESKNIVSRAMVINNKKTLKIKKGIKFNSDELYAMGAHEVGVHLLTTINSRNQPLKILNLGLPGNTETQEGLAILAEYLSGHLDFKRLKMLAYRTISVNLMLKGYSFSEVFEYFMDEHGFNREDAFYLTTRIFRSGGFTKDYLYLKGFVKIKNFYQKRDLKNLLVGKTSIEYYDIIKELIDRKILKSPKYITKEFSKEKNEDDILDFIIGSLKGIKE
ncbi:MAG: flavohemoglobin expression-modulating QEGLA motif protein [Fusobacteriota bacterium]